MDDLLFRVDMKTSLESHILRIVRDYDLGDLLSYEPIPVGYEELNIWLKTSSNEFVIKIFSKDKSLQTIMSYVNGLEQFLNAGIPCPTLHISSHGLVHIVEGNSKPVYSCVLTYFKGKRLSEVYVSDEDCKTLLKYITKIHHMSFPVVPEYDPWGTINLQKEYKIKQRHLSTEDKHLLKPILDQFKKIQFSEFRQSVIHGDLQKSNILRNDSGEFCVLDLGCLNNSASIVDLAIFLALVCFDTEDEETCIRRYQDILSDYLTVHQLSFNEIITLPLLIQATYAIYLLSSNFELKHNDNISKQSKDWYTSSRNSLIAFQKNAIDKKLISLGMNYFSGIDARTQHTNKFLELYENKFSSAKDLVLRVVGDHLGIPAPALSLQDHINIDLGADSLDRLELIMTIEELFEIKISDKETEKIKTIGDITKLVEEQAAIF